MKLRHLLIIVGVAIGTFVISLIIKTFLPQHLEIDETLETGEESFHPLSLPDVEVTFLRCGSHKVPACLAVRGTYSLAPRSIVYSAALIRHPKGTFLYDSGLCASTKTMLKDQPFWFRNVLGTFTMEASIGECLQQQNLKPQDLDFVLLSHLHWDHVSGVPDLPGVPLRVHRVEQEATQRGPLAQIQGVIKRFLGDNPIELFDLSGPAYAGFQASYDLFGDGSIVLVPLPGHTDGQVGMLIHRANGDPLFLLADAVWLAENYLKPAPMHPLFWSLLANDEMSASRTLVKLHRFARHHPEVSMIAMHDACLQETFAQKVPSGSLSFIPRLKDGGLQKGTL